MKSLNKIKRKNSPFLKGLFFLKAHLDKVLKICYNKGAL
jgi:hypothetical protein